MERTSVLGVGLIIFFVACAPSTRTSFSAASGSNVEVVETQLLDGAYEFISETVVLEKPDNRTDERRSPEWKGLWIFQNGRFSRTLMKKERAFTSLAPESMGYASDAGTYKVVSGTLTLSPEITLYPLPAEYQPLEFRFKSNGDTITLTRTLRPYMEDLSSGRQTVVLQKTP